MECNACEIELERLLCNIPSAWRKQIIAALCKHLNSQFDCQKIAECLSDELTTIDYKCLVASQAQWDALSFNGKIQKIIDKVCSLIGADPLQITDTNSINLSGAGTFALPLTADLIKDPDLTNILQIRPAGVYVPPSIPGLSNVSIADTNSVNLSGNGNNIPITADVIISPDPGNITVIHTNGLYTPEPLPICDLVNGGFTLTSEQGTNLLSPHFLVRTLTGGTFDQGECFKINPPTGFAVVGNTRSSAFGKMEWFDTLTLANVAAIPGETVLIFINTTEHIIAKNKVNYEGIGNPIIGQFIVNTNYDGKLFNLTINMNYGPIVTPAITYVGTSYIEFTTVTILSGANVKTLSIHENVTIKGGDYVINIDITGGPTHSPKLSYCRLFGNNNTVSEGGTLSNFYLENNELTNPFGKTLLYAQGSSTDRDIYTTIKDGLIVSKALHCFDTIFSVVVSNVVANNINGRGIYIHSGGDDNNCNVLVTNCTGKSKTNTGFMSVASNAITFNPNSLTNINISNCTGFSTTNAGILLINGNLRNCQGYSEAGSGILIGGSDRPSSSSHIIDCVGESGLSYGLEVTRDCFVYGGTFISRGNSVSANPISLKENTGGLRIDNYNLIGVKTIQYSLTALSIKNNGHIPPVRISGCQFACPYLATNVPGIDPTLTLRAVATDAFGNIK